MTDSRDPRGPLAPYLPLMLLAPVMAVVLYVRIRLLAVPLERDEGEFAYIGQLLLKGIAPYSHAYTMKLPGVGVAYALLMYTFGQSAFGIHLGLLLVNATCTYLVYRLALRLFDRDTALYAGASYAALSLSCTVYGLFAHATHFVVLFVLAGCLAQLYSLERQRRLPLFGSGLCFGTAVAMKQHAVLLLIFAVLYLWARLSRPPSTAATFLRRAAIVWFVSGAAVPYALIVLWMAVSGNFDEFWLWTVRYAGEYASGSPLALGLAAFRDTFGEILSVQWPLWVLAGSGCVLVATNRVRCADRGFFFGFLAFSLLSICPGLYFRGHYFVLLLPAVAISAGAAVGAAQGWLSTRRSPRTARYCAPLLLLAAIAFGLYGERSSFFIQSPRQVSRSVYGPNPFPEAIPIADYIRRHSLPEDRVAVLGSEPEIYFYADRLSATGHIYMYGLMENQPYAGRMQAQMIRDIEDARPKYVVVVNVAFSWLVQENSERRLLLWGEDYLRRYYDPVGVVDIIDADTTRYLWDASAAAYTPISQNYVTLFRRRGLPRGSR